MSGRDEDEVRLRAFPPVWEEAKSWFAGLPAERKRTWEVLKDTFMAKFSAGNNPEELWRRLSSLRQVTLDSYQAYETQFLTMWAQWELSLPEGEGAPNFLKKDKFLAGLSPSLQEKVKGKFPENFEEAMQWARLKDRKLQFQAHVMRREPLPPSNMMNEQQQQAPSTAPAADPHLELLQRVTNQLNELSVNFVQASRMQAQPPNEERVQNAQPPRRPLRRQELLCYNCGEEGHGMYFCPHPRRYPGNGQGRGPRR